MNKCDTKPTALRRFRVRKRNRQENCAQTQLGLGAVRSLQPETVLEFRTNPSVLFALPFLSHYLQESHQTTSIKPLGQLRPPAPAQISRTAVKKQRHTDPSGLTSKGEEFICPSRRRSHEGAMNVTQSKA
ncbi:uncharacterized [Tachysurus ichikawai]